MNQKPYVFRKLKLLFAVITCVVSLAANAGKQATCPLWTATDLNFFTTAIEYSNYRYGDLYPNCNQCTLDQFNSTYPAAPLTADSAIIDFTGFSSSTGYYEGITGLLYYVQNDNNTNEDVLGMLILAGTSDPSALFPGPGSATEILAAYDPSTGNINTASSAGLDPSLTQITPAQIAACINDINNTSIPTGVPKK